MSACHAGAGPVVGYRFEDDARVGWEASGGFAVVRGSVGQAFGYGEGEDTVFYAAAEPGALVGATLGLDVASSGDTGFMPGGWLGAPVYWDQSEENEVLGMQPMVTLALGYRYAHGHEIYFAPKVNLYDLDDVRLGGH